MFPKIRGTPKWMVYDGKPYGWFGGTTIFGNIHIDHVQLSFYDSLTVRQKVPDLNKLQEETSPENITISPCMILTSMFRRTSGHHNDRLCYTTGISNTQVVRVCFRGSNQWRWQPPQKKEYSKNTRILLSIGPIKKWQKGSPGRISTPAPRVTCCIKPHICFQKRL